MAARMTPGGVTVIGCRPQLIRILDFLGGATVRNLRYAVQPDRAAVVSARP
jgi:hypothetical protein